MSVKIEPVQRSQFCEWLRVREALYTGVDQKFHEQEMEIYFCADDKICLLAIEESGDVCGIVEVSLRNVVDGCLSSPVGYIEGIRVEESYQGKGVARLLIQHAEKWCRSKGCQELATDAELTNQAAQQFHQHMGFHETYRIVEYRKTL